MIRNNDDRRVEQSWRADRYAEKARYVADLATPLLELLAPRPGERILDLGCGDGALTEKIVALGARVVGIDSSPDQIEAARARGIDARLADAHDLAFAAEFDGVLTNAALHWMLEPDRVIAGMHRALLPGGRLVGEMGGEGNVAAIATALTAALDRRGIDGRAASPWYFPSAEAYGRRLAAAGFAVRSIVIIQRPTPLPAGLAGWLETFGESFVLRVPEAERAAMVTELETALRPVLFEPQGRWIADYVRLRFVAEKPV